ncbi:unnamed protein product [Arabis nemorensis]|uniref:J domain-containing protein n=1 Tax=Arabis nemorensis TaxID=586526 RepID=A0A565AY62_9BRAS|nr:unnamed protein product [Arabis nemorensis]
MAPPATKRWCLALILLSLSFFIQSSTAIYCGAEDCYALLGVAQDANASDIKRSYYKLSLKHHPDKNPDPESKKLFVKIATAYEILKDNETRSQYDYAIEHPEEVFYNTAQYYRAKYGHKSDPRAVLVGLLVVLSAFQYLNNVARYNEAIATVKRTPAYKNKLKALELERTGGVTNKKKGPKQIDQKLQEELSNELDLQIKGAEKPSVWDLLGVRFILLPYTIIKLLAWYSSWVWRYKVNKAPYSWEDASYLTRRSLGVPLDAWTNLDEYKKEDLVQKRLWEKQNLENYFAEMRKESKRRR